MRDQTKSVKFGSDFLPLQVDVTPDNGMLQEKRSLIINLQDNSNSEDQIYSEVNNIYQLCM